MRFNILLCAIIAVFIAAAMYFINHVPKMKHHISYLALGDSYTIGYKVRYAENYPNQVTGLLREKHIDIADPVIVAYPGWTSNDLINALNTNNVHDTFSFVTLLIGTNDLNQGTSLNAYILNLEQLLTRAAILTGGHPENIFVLSVPDISITPAIEGGSKERFAKGVEQYNIANKAAALAHKCQYIDITYALREHATDASYYLEDWVHPTSKGYAIWAKQIALVIETTLKR